MNQVDITEIYNREYLVLEPLLYSIYIQSLLVFFLFIKKLHSNAIRLTGSCYSNIIALLLGLTACFVLICKYKG